ncbi:MAG: hypothetical protein WCX30_02135 [Candidatus Paceibacterota bacterium]|jgi:hypothetical protein|nr:hypothetical protein [bacterium]
MEKSWGFTLIEIVFYIAIMATLAFASFLVLNIINQAELKNRTVSEVEYQGLKYIEILSQEIRNSIAIDSFTDNSLVLRVDDPMRNPVEFTFIDGNIYLQEGLQEANKLNNSMISVTPMFFKNNSISGEYDSIRLSLKVFYNNVGGRSEYDYSKIFYVTASTRQKK